MKQLFFLIMIILAAPLAAQKVTKDAAGNYTQVTRKQPENGPATIETLTKGATATGATYTNSKGEKFPVYLSKSGKAFWVATSKKTGIPYRRYLKEN